MRIQINTNDNYYISPIARCLRIAGNEFCFSIKQNKLLPCYSIWVDETPIAYLSHGDSLELSVKDKQNIDRFDYKIIFKYHYATFVDYGEYANRIIPCGLWRWLSSDFSFSREELLNKKRSIDVQSRMRCFNSNPNSRKTPWAAARRTIVKEALKLNKEEYVARAGSKIPMEQYIKELYDSKIGFIWSASAYLGWKIPEFIQHGVVMITEPLGLNYPFRDDIVLEDDIHCVFCNEPNKFGEVAKNLLRNPSRLEQIRKNVVDLWFDKLCPEKMGEWYYRRLISVL